MAFQGRHARYPPPSTRWEVFISSATACRATYQGLGLLKMAAEAGVAGAQYNIGVLYRDGQGLPRDLVQSAAWFKKAAIRAIPPPIQSGSCYATGKGVARTPPRR